MFGNYILDTMRKVIKLTNGNGTESMFNRTNLLYKDMYVDLMKGKKVSYVTKNSNEIIERRFKILFNADVISIRQSEISVKLKLIKL